MFSWRKRAVAGARRSIAPGITLHFLGRTVGSCQAIARRPANMFKRILAGSIPTGCLR